ncbi:COMM domain-containing protein 10 [Bacillus rossius redtenbacheri]|uniref:COMM domain-containing protein 10 n=1 Tax=Bacillus rossius redtenbacheri TaxID=93214 RepID=UPI002FDD44B1
MAWISENKCLQKASDIINGLDSSKFPLLLNRITQTMQQGDDQTKVFTAAEMEKLQTSLLLEERDVGLLLDSITLILEKAACHMTKPGALQQQLVQELSLNVDKAESLASSWAAAARPIVDRLRRMSIFPMRLDDVHWKLNLQTASSAHGREKTPKAVLQFELKCAQDGVVSDEDLSMEFDHEELYRFYNQLERIQTQLDALR